MLKRISVHQLTLGMHLQEFCGSWMEHPFFRTSFVLKDPKDIESIVGSSIKEVWIDCSKGLDVAADVDAVTEAQSEAQVEDELHQVAEGEREIAPVSAAQELERAAQICRQAKQAVVSMFEEVRMGNAVDVGGAKLLVEEISDSVSRNPGALISLARLKTADDYTYMHSVAVCAMMVALAKQLGLDQAQTRSAGLAGLLHDLGKAVMPMNVLNKPGKLTDGEFTIIKSHPVQGHKMLLGGVNVDPIAIEVCLHHHEKMDGSGYPDRLEGDQISLLALVRLSSVRIGVVTEQTSKSLTTPRVKVFFSTKSNMRIVPQLIDLSSPDTGEKIAAREDPAKWHFPDLNELWSGLPSAPW